MPRAVPTVRDPLGSRDSRDPRVRRAPARGAAAVGVVLGLIVLAGCGGGSTDAGPARSSASPTTPSPTPTPTPPPATTPATPTPAAPAPSVTASPASPAPAAHQRHRRPANPSNPLAHRRWGTYLGPTDQSYTPWARASGDTKSLLGKIALAPKAKWFGAWIGNNQIAGKVSDYIASAQDGDPQTLVQMAVFRMVPWEHEACSRLPSAAEASSYRDWIDRFAGDVGEAHTAIILQPDGPFALCAPHGSTVPSQLVAYAAQKFSALPHTAVYIDVGAADWPNAGAQGGVEAATQIAVQGGVKYARGIALNSTHYSATEDEVDRGTAVVKALAGLGMRGKKFVVNTSSNGKPFEFGDYRGPDPDNARVCTSQSDGPTCVALGIPPTWHVGAKRWDLPTRTVKLARRYADGFLWFGRPWLYDQADPFVMDRALMLARVSRW